MDFGHVCWVLVYYFFDILHSGCDSVIEQFVNVSSLLVSSIALQIFD